MELYYCKVKTGANFGDDLNPWLWPKIFNKPLTDILDAQTLFVGIGTILNDAVPASFRKKIIFSSGTGYGAPPIIDDSWDIRCVRGPLTAERLGLPRQKAITDGAILLYEFVKPSISRQGIGFMPHHQTAVVSDWPSVCADLNIKYIDPRGTVDEIITQLNDCELLITEAMHGAIVADVLRIPWYAVKTREKILDFKWHDWTKSLDIELDFTLLPQVVTKGKRRYLRPFNSYIARQRLMKIIQQKKPTLSTDRVLVERHERMLEEAHKLTG